MYNAGLIRKKFYVVKVNNLIKYALFFPGRRCRCISTKKRNSHLFCGLSRKGSEDIPDILNTLREHDVKATFFIIGVWAEKNPDEVKMIADEGHDVANHSYSHYKMSSLNSSAIKSEILKCDRVLKKITGKDVELFRPPYESLYNTMGC